MNLEKIVVAQQNKIIFIKPEEIIFCQSDSCYTNIYLVGDRQILIVKSLTKFHKELLSKAFIRVNQSFIINKNFIQSVDKKKRCIELESGQIVPFTVSLKQLLLMMRQEADLTLLPFDDTIEA